MSDNYRICTLQVLQGDLCRKDEYEFLNQVQGNFCILRKRSFCCLRDLVDSRLVCQCYIQMSTQAPCFSLEDLVILIHLYYKLYSQEILDNLMFPHIQMSINIDYLFLTPTSIFQETLKLSEIKAFFGLDYLSVIMRYFCPSFLMQFVPLFPG